MQVSLSRRETPRDHIVKKGGACAKWGREVVWLPAQKVGMQDWVRDKTHSHLSSVHIVLR